MHLAAENGHEEVADLLLMHKAFVNAKSKLGLTPLHLASQNGFNKLVKVLIEKHGATIDALSLVRIIETSTVKVHQFEMYALKKTRKIKLFCKQPNNI